MLKKLNLLRFRMQVRKERINFYINVLTVAAYGVIIGMLVYYVLADRISVGAFAAVFAALREFYGFMDEVISERLAIAIENMATVKNYLAFIKEDKGEPGRQELPERFEIRLDHVSFAYPQPETGEQKFVLSDINLRIPWGQTVALVGENGSGKSTLCHIIAGLYSPTQRTVSYGEVQGGAVRIARGISAVFQKFCRYSMSLGENIRISDMDGDQSEDKLRRICKDIGVVPEWAGGIDGMLGKEFGGAEVSGGQWQRIAIARGIYRNNSLLILDEPTAAIDALEEKYLYEEFGKLSRDCTSVIVTHRLASAQIADRILVVKDGRIVQDGSHGELVAVEGEYRTMYELQRQWYKE
ncbi:MAG: ATP-binding cassette domain-containing protein [Lachnospiraceae bacterium]|nr:ATP-binding cassette domain-containing protein [Lachnospiraceae bacterium]